ncbi:MAG TPA: hypothetical protein VJH63_01705 [Candidatus Paceibacterota bacterium]
MKTLIVLFVGLALSAGNAAAQAVTGPTGWVRSPDGKLFVVDSAYLPTTLRTLEYIEKLQRHPSGPILKAVAGALAVEKSGRIPLAQMRALVEPVRKRFDVLEKRDQKGDYGATLEITLMALKFNICAAESEQAAKKK